MRRAAAAMVLALAATAVWWGAPAVRCGSLFDGVRYARGECVGVTDGTFEFAPEYSAIQEKIVDENEWAAREAAKTGIPLVKVAMLVPFTTSDSGAITPGQVRSALEGAYVALYRSNHTYELGDPKPLVQLYLANVGSRQSQWRIPVSRIEDMAGDKHPLVAVMGQALSTERTKQAALRLAEQEIPMVTGATTADGLDHDSVDGLVRAAPSTTDFAVALKRYVSRRDDLQTATLVFDDVAEDLFVNTLRKAYEKQFADYLVATSQPFHGASIAEGGEDVFEPITLHICAAESDMVLFAGRATDMRAFLEALNERACGQRPITVLFAEIGIYPWAGEQADLLKEGDITILNATGADPRWADKGDQGEPPGFADFYAHFRNLVSGEPERLKNGYAVTYHDAMATAVRAVRLSSDPLDAEPPVPAQVRDRLLLLVGQHAVRAASGTLSFSVNRSGNPVGKYVPVVPVPFSAEAADDDPYITPEG